MPTTDPIEILLNQDRWATNNLIEACRQLTEDQFHQPFQMGMGSLYNNILHMLSALRGWGDLLAGRQSRTAMEGRYTLDELSQVLDEIADDMWESWKKHPVDATVSGERGGKTYTFVRAAVLTHVTTHGMHHRAQCLNMLKHLGVEPLPPSSVVEWIMMVDGKTGE